MSPAAPGTLRTESRLTGFDGLRAVAALSLLVFHVVLFFPGFFNTTLWELLIQLRGGVWIFFVISGFLLYRPHVAAHLGQRPRPGLRSYASSRVLRIFPAYIVVVTVLTYVIHETHLQRPDHFLVQLGLLQIYSRSVFLLSDPLSITWSLATELSFYVFLPCWAFLIGVVGARVGMLRTEIAGLAVLVVIGMVWQIASEGDLLQRFWLPNFFPVFAVGMGFAVAAAHLRDGAVTWFRSLAGRGSVCWLLAAAVLVFKAAVLPRDTGLAGGHGFEPQLCYTTFAFLVVLPCVLGSPGRSLVHRFVDARVMVFLGTVSYGIFLWNSTVISWVELDWVGPTHLRGHLPVVLAATFLATVGIATASWYLVERPALSLKRRFAH